MSENLHISKLFLTFAAQFHQPKMSQSKDHITGSLDCIQKVQSFVRYISDEADRQRFTSLLSELRDHVVGTSNELAVCEYRIAELSKQQYEPIVVAQGGECCRYIDADALAKGAYTVEEFEKKLRHACESEARVLGEFINKYFKLGYLDFHGENKKKIYTHLREYFPTMRRYSYTHFAACI